MIGVFLGEHDLTGALYIELPDFCEFPVMTGPVKQGRAQFLFQLHDLIVKFLVILTKHGTGTVISRIRLWKKEG